jgi:uncharacterized coiled-coil DUF342 family protein
MKQQLIDSIVELIEFAYASAKKFIDKVETWRERSKETYADMQEIIRQYEELKSKKDG